MQKKIWLLTLLGFGLSTSVFATDILTDTVTDTENVVEDVVTLDHFYDHDWADYLLIDKDSGKLKLLKGVHDGVATHTDSLRYNYSETIGDTLTDLHTKRSGVITGIKKQGTMDVTGHHGKVTRYQYVIFKVKH